MHCDQIRQCKRRYWLIFVVPSCLWSHNARYIEQYALSTTYALVILLYHLFMSMYTYFTASMKWVIFLIYQIPRNMWTLLQSGMPPGVTVGYRAGNDVLKANRRCHSDGLYWYHHNATRLSFFHTSVDVIFPIFKWVIVNWEERRHL